MLILDRFEGKFAVIEYNNKTFNLPKETIPAQAQEGDVLSIVIDQKATAERRKKIRDLAADLFTE